MRNLSHRWEEAKLKVFSGAKSTQLNYYVRPTLDEFQFDDATIHVGVNDILWSKSKNDLRKLPNNIIDIAMTCRSYNIGKIFISSILPSRRTFINTKSINDTLKQLCQENNFAFIDGFQITSNKLWKDGIR